MHVVYLGTLLTVIASTWFCVWRYIPEFRDGMENICALRFGIALRQLAKAFILVTIAVLVTAAMTLATRWLFENEIATSLVVSLPFGIAFGFKFLIYIEIARILLFKRKE